MTKKINIIFLISIGALVIVGVVLYWSNHNTQTYSKTSTLTSGVPLSESQDEVMELKQSPETVQEIPIIVYHSIAPAPSHSESVMQKRFRIDPENFALQMQYLKDNKYTPITFDHLAEYLLHDENIPDKPIVLTFDDGLENQFQYAFPILQKFGFVGTFFIYPGVTEHKGFMNWEQLAVLVADGQEIGDHSMIHYNLTSLDIKDLNHEIVESKKILEEKLDITVMTLAYPHYAENEIVREAVLEAGYIAARAGWRTVKNSADEIFHLTAREATNKKSPFMMP